MLTVVVSSPAKCPVRISGPFVSAAIAHTSSLDPSAKSTVPCVVGSAVPRFVRNLPTVKVKKWKKREQYKQSQYSVSLCGLCIYQFILGEEFTTLISFLNSN